MLEISTLVSLVYFSCNHYHVATLSTHAYDYDDHVYDEPL